VKDLIPLLQTVAWVALALYLVRYFRPEVVLLRKVLNQRLEGGGMVRTGPLELGALQKEVQDVTRELGDLNARVSELFLATMSWAMYYHLQKLASNSFGRFQMTQGLRRELYHLRDIGYIEVVLYPTSLLKGPTFRLSCALPKLAGALFRCVAISRVPKELWHAMTQWLGPTNRQRIRSRVAHHGSGLTDGSLPEAADLRTRRSPTLSDTRKGVAFGRSLVARSLVLARNLNLFVIGAGTYHRLGPTGR